MRGAGHAQPGRPGTVYVIGGGPAGLAVGAELRRDGMWPVILERGGSVATSWRAGYDRLHLHTARALSGLPGFAIPRRYGRWPSRDAVIDYLEQYRVRHDLEVRAHTEVERIEDARSVSGGDVFWIIHTTTGEQFSAHAVIVATGNHHTAWTPQWPGLASYTGTLLHSRQYRNPAPFAGQDVLVAGAGNTGTEIAADLAGGGARRVWIAVRTPPHIVARDVAGVPSQAAGILASHLPGPLVDRVSVRQATDLSAYGLPRPVDGVFTYLARDRRVAVQDLGFVSAVRAGQVTPVAAVASIERGKVTLADGSVLSPQAVIAATGYRSGLEKLVGQLGVLDDRGLPKVHGGAPAAPGLYFLGYTISARGALRDIAAEARRIGSALADAGT